MLQVENEPNQPDALTSEPHFLFPLRFDVRVEKREVHVSTDII